MSLLEVPLQNPNAGQHRYQLAQTLNEIISGRSNAAGTFTLTTSSATTEIDDNQFAIDQVPVLIPTTSNAAAELANGTMYLSARANGSFTFTHASNAQSDRTFLYIRAG